MIKARVKRVVVSPDILAHVFETGTGWRVESGIPKGSRLRGLTQDPQTQCLHLFIEHPSFEEVFLENEITPQLEMLFKKI